ncbi:receptor-like protein kinase FERONIA-like [Dorcoceras hygrometricum]|uniref:Receptor-like protein kinase FERONIA-like n=1 Tax=Dorcoceras hygrometricum TaxID=472368 RepID=A0A2Z7CHT4_9LAMI|nr:receptor-like protein kinase FERONIA-like [Dorcoceras hygrometricum]
MILGPPPERSLRSLGQTRSWKRPRAIPELFLQNPGVTSDLSEVSVKTPELRVCFPVALAFDDVGKVDTAVLDTRVPRNNIPAHYRRQRPEANVFISCGSAGDSTARDGRVWAGDSGLESSSSLLINGRSTTSQAIHGFGLLDPVPYKTARISPHEFQYVIRVSPGQKFIRLHFYQDSWLTTSKPVFTVKANHYTLLTNFSEDALGVKHVIKEYCVNIEGDRGLTLTFSPAFRVRKRGAFYAFVNGIEVVSMPTGLYFTPDEESGVRVVGRKYSLYIDNATALELVQRLNVAGASIPPTEDSSMYRSWDDDTKFLLDSAAVPTWRIPVHMGFRYLIRLHFSETQWRTGKSKSKEFTVVINDQIAGYTADIFRNGQDSEAATRKDYIVMMERNKMVGHRNITIALQKKFKSIDHDRYRNILRGIEVFKLSNPDNNLAGMESFVELHSSVSIPPQRKKLVSLYRINFIGTVLTVSLVLLNIAVFHLKRFSDSSHGTRNTRSSFSEHQCRQFSIDEIRSSTNDFDLEFYIGRGGYGNVYKGSIGGGTETVAFKRRKSWSKQGDNEFWTEIRLLSKIRHHNLVSLVGYCNDGEERILVYQYMNQGTLADHLYKKKRHANSNPIPWETRLNIVIGAASGLYYLHSRHGIIHRDVKSSNILLDDNWVAKISDFGLSKKGPGTDLFSHISTQIKGTFGYLDPEYCSTRKLTTKSDVYAFGVVLFEVLSGRPAVSTRLQEEKHCLAEWARHCIREGKVDQLVDQNLKEQITPSSLNFFLSIAGRCLHTQSRGRPTMAEVVKGLQQALRFQKNQDPVLEQLDHEDENTSDQYFHPSEDTSGSGSTHISSNSPTGIVGEEFCFPHAVDLTVKRKVGFSSKHFQVLDENGSLLVNVKGGVWAFEMKRTMYDSEGAPIITMGRKKDTWRQEWIVHRGDSLDGDNLLYTVVIIPNQPKPQLEVFLASNPSSRICDFRLLGNFKSLSFNVYKGDAVIAKVKQSFEGGNGIARICSGIDYLFIVSILLIYDEIL